MLRINTDSLRPGMIVAKSIYNNDGTVIIASGIPIRDIYIKRLLERGVSEVCIAMDETSDIYIQDIIQEETRVATKKIIRQVMGSIQLDQSINIHEVFAIVDDILEYLLSKPNIIENISDIRAVDEYTFEHCVNVCILSLLMGIIIGYSKKELRDLGIGAMLHDVGKIMVPHQILNKPGRLTEEEYDIMKKHSNLGYEILKNYTDINESAKLVVLTHHERYNGTGYPFNCKGEEIHEFSRIVAIADVFDAMTSDRIYSKKSMPHEVIEYLISMGNHQFDYEMVEIFARYIAYFPIGTLVRLSTGDIGVVIDNNSNHPYRPKIRCIKNAEYESYSSHIEIELEESPSIAIVEVLEDTKL